MKITITGHRPSKLGGDYDLKGPLVQWVKEEIEVIPQIKEATEFISGMALGIDTLFAKIAMYMDIPLIAAVPFVGQESRWPIESRRLYDKILSWHKTTLVVVSTGGYSGWKMQRRNEWMVDNADFLIGVWDGSNGGIYNCLKYAEGKIKKKIILLQDYYDLKL